MNEESAIEKFCARCARSKPREEFPRDTSKGMGYRRPTCKDCCAQKPKVQMREERDE